MKSFKKILLGSFLVLLTITACTPKEREPAALDMFASCLKNKGATFYGAFWCPHCQNQKKLFGGSVDLLPYVECSTPDSKGQTQICIDKEVKSYPTWEFADKSRETGELSLSKLAEKTGCPLPENP